VSAAISNIISYVRVCYSLHTILFSSRHLLKDFMYSRLLAFTSSIYSFSECQLVSRPCYPVHERIHVSLCLVFRLQLPFSNPVSFLRLMTPATFCVTVCVICLRMSWNVYFAPLHVPGLESLEYGHRDFFFIFYYSYIVWRRAREPILPVSGYSY
jgi:hypothetical protein